MRVLVTGATGFVGANLARALVQNDDIELSITIRASSNLWRINDIKDKFRNICIADFSDRGQVFDLIEQVQPNIIYHLATYGGLGREREKERIINANLYATINLLDAAVQIKVDQFINTGSSSEYGLKDQLMREDDICCPLSLYGITKLAATNYCSMVGQLTGFKVCTLRLFSPFGEYEDKTRLYPTIVDALLAGRQPHLSNPMNVRDFIEVEKVVSIYQKVITVEYKPGDIINVGSGKQQTIAEFFNKVANSLDSKIEPLWHSTMGRMNEPKIWEADICKLKALRLV